MGLPIESRISATARRKRQRVAPALAIPEDTTSRFYQHDAFSERPRTFGINHEALEAVGAFYEANTRRANPPRKARLVLVRTFLPVPVRVHRSPVSHLGGRIANMLTRDSHDDSVIDMPFRRRFYRRHRRELRSTPTTRFTVFMADAGDDTPAVPTTLRSQDTNEQPTSNREDPSPNTSSAISILYAEDGDPVSANVWEIGCWAGTHELAGVDMFQVFLDVLTEATTIPSCPIEALCISDNLDVFVAVVAGINLLKDLSAELHSTYDKSSSYFLHPITGSRIEIVTIR